MSLLSAPRGAAPGSARLRRSSHPLPGAPLARRGASHGAGGAHLAAGQVPGSSGDAPTPAAQAPPASLPLPGGGSTARRGRERLRGGERGAAAGRHFKSPRRPQSGGCGACFAPERRRPGSGAEGAGSEEPLDRREAGLWLRALIPRRSPAPGGSRSLAAGRCSPSRVTAGPAGGPVRPRGKQVGRRAVLLLPPAFRRKTKFSGFTNVGCGRGGDIKCSAPFCRSHGLLYPHTEIPSSQHLTGTDLSCFLIICETRHCLFFLQRSYVSHLDSVIMSLERW